MTKERQDLYDHTVDHYFPGLIKVNGLCPKGHFWQIPCGQKSRWVKCPTCGDDVTWEDQKLDHFQKMLAIISKAMSTGSNPSLVAPQRGFDPGGDFIQRRKKALENLVAPYGVIPTQKYFQNEAKLSMQQEPSYQEEPVLSEKVQKAKEIKNAIDRELSGHKLHLDQRWSEVMMRDFDIEKFDTGGYSNQVITAVYDILVKIKPLWDLVAKDQVREFHLESRLEGSPQAKGYFSQQELSDSDEEGIIYLFKPALEFIGSPYRIPDIPGLMEIIVHEIGHLVTHTILAEAYDRWTQYFDWRPTEQVKGHGETGYNISSEDPKWSYGKEQVFPSWYASKSPKEDYAETWVHFIYNADELKSRSPERFKRMAQEWQRLGHPEVLDELRRSVYATARKFQSGTAEQSLGKRQDVQNQDSQERHFPPKVLPANPSSRADGQGA